MNAVNHPGDAEYLGAVAGMNDIYRSDYPAPGDTVLVERPFYGNLVRATVLETHGHMVTVEYDGERLGYTVDEIKRTDDQRS